MIKQDFTLAPGSPDLKPGRGANARRSPGRERGKHYVWEVRHVGLLGIKYEVAVRSDLVDDCAVKAEGAEADTSGKEVLRGVVDAAVLGCVSCLHGLASFFNFFNTA